MIHKLKKENQSFYAKCKENTWEVGKQEIDTKTILTF